MSEKRLHLLEIKGHRDNQQEEAFSWTDGYRGAVVGCITEVTVDGSIWVDFPDNPDRPLCALTVTDITDQDEGRSVLILFEQGDRRRPIIVGCLSGKAAGAQEKGIEVNVARQANDEIRVDGKKIAIEAEHELLLRCGQGSITVKNDGSIVIKGTKIVSRSKGVNKIKGASVSIN